RPPSCSEPCRALSRKRLTSRGWRQTTDPRPLRTMTMTALLPPKHPAAPAWLGTQQRSSIAQASRYPGALAVLATGVAHIEQYSVDNYSTVPTIGTLFLLNFIAAIVIAVGLIAPLRRVTGRYTDVVRAVLAVGGIGLGVGSLAGLFVSETTGLFGFVEHGYRM